MDYEELKRIRNEKNKFGKFLGLHTLEISEGYARGELKVSDDFINAIGSVHGGCIFTLADTMAGAAAASRGEFMTTISGNINYLAPAINTGKLIAVAKEIKHGKKISVFDVNVYNEKEDLLANGSFSYFNLGIPVVK